MASINSDSSVSSSASNIYTALSAKNKGIGGLATGLDTDGIVEALTTGTRSKIAKQQQQKTLLQWKTTAYRDVVSTFNAFSTKWLKYSTSNLNLKSYDFYSATKASANSDAVNVKATNYATPGNFQIDKVLKLASSKSYTSAEMSLDLTGDEVDVLAENYTNKTLTLTVDGVTHTIKLETLESNKSSRPDFQTELQRLVTEKFGEKSRVDSLGNIIPNQYDPKVVVTVTGTHPDLTVDLSSDASHITVTSTSYDNGLGFAQNASNRIDTSVTIGELFPDLVGNTFTFSINEVEFTFKSGDSMSSIMLNINTSAAGVRIDFDPIDQVFKIATRSTGAGDTLRIADITGNFMSALFGAKGGSTVTSPSNNYTLGYEPLVEGLAFGYDFTVPGVFPTNFTAKNLMEAMDTNGNPYVFEITVEGVTHKISVDISDYMTELNTFISAQLLAAQEHDPAISNYNDLAAHAGTQPYQAILEEIEDQARTYFLNAVGYAIKDAGLNDVVFFKIDTAGKMSFGAHDEMTKFTVGVDSAPNAGEVDLFSIIYGNTTPVNNYTSNQNPTSLGSIISTPGTITMTIDDLPSPAFTYPYTATTTLRQLYDALEAQFPGAFTVRDGVITLSGGDDKLKFNDSGDLFENLFGVSNYETAAQSDFTSATGPQVTEGSDAEIVYNGVVLNQKNNTFEINGVEITLNETSDDAIKITVTSSPDELVDRIFDFIEDYNTLVETMNKITGEKPVSGYEPLTDDQKADMTEEEIKKWENEAKKGLLFNDSPIKKIMSQLRGVFYPDPDDPPSVGVLPFQIGLQTVSLYNSSGTAMDYKNSGKIDTSEVQKDILRNAIEENPDIIRLVFYNDAKDGIADKMEEIINNATSTTYLPNDYGTNFLRGTLIELAGAESFDEDSYALGKRIKTIDERISTLKMRLEYEYNRYWKQFSNLEVAIQRMSTQMSWFDDL